MGRTGDLADQGQVLRPFLADLRRISLERSLVPDVVVFSGDLAFGAVQSSTLEEQYGRVLEFFDEVAAAVGKDRHTLPFFCVPGNHDLDRKLITPADTAWISEQESHPEIIDSTIAEGGLHWGTISKRQDAYRAFLQKTLAGGWNVDRTTLLHTAEFDHQGKKIAIAGLNTAWSSHTVREEGRLWLGRDQVNKATEVVARADAAIVVAHHPPEWLVGRDSDSFTSVLCRQPSVKLILHGHRHTFRVSRLDGKVEVRAGAIYASAIRPAGYSIIELDVEKDHVAIHGRSRREDENIDFVATQIPGNDGEGVITHDLGPSPSNRSRESGQTPHVTGSAKDPLFPLKPLGSLVEDTLVNRFSFVWEPGIDWRASSPVFVYWPVRLRRPSPIHAVQAFVAGALQRAGASIELWIDDLGLTEYNFEVFERRLLFWLQSVGGDPERVTRYSAVTELRSMSRTPWALLQSWWGVSPDRMVDVLTLTKVVDRTAGSPGPDDWERLARRSPKRLLTPAVVWAFLERSIDANGACAVTLGGHDERALWGKFQAVSKLGRRVSHLYVPELVRSASEEPVHMALEPLAWLGQSDIERYLRGEIQAGGLTDAVKWCYSQCAQLPIVLRGEQPITVDGEQRRHTLSDDADVNLQEFAGKLARVINTNLFSPPDSPR